MKKKKLYHDSPYYIRVFENKLGFRLCYSLVPLYYACVNNVL